MVLSNGWELIEDQYGLDYLYRLYLKADPDNEGRVTVPVLRDKKSQSIVSNESADIIPTQLVPVEPYQDFTSSHNRNLFDRKEQPLTAGGSG